MKGLMCLLLSLLLVGCQHRAAPHSDPVPKHDSLVVHSEFVDEDRVINVWVPPEYATGATRYPVLYMPDGGIGEDFPHIANTLAKLVAAKAIPPVILVGIENTDRGRDLTGYTEAEYDLKHFDAADGASNFRSFITRELVPTIDGKYRTTGYRGIIGESLAGLFVVETFLVAPDSFDYYIAMDPSLWWNNQYLVKHAESLLADFPARDIRFWFAGSSAEDISPHTRQVMSVLQKSAPTNLTWKYSDEPGEEHRTIFRATKEKAIAWALADAAVAGR